jgi:hypothetical protein
VAVWNARIPAARNQAWIGLAIFGAGLWLAYQIGEEILYPIPYGGLTVYQNYINNAYSWMLVGVLFRLPQLQAEDPGLATVPARGHVSRAGRFLRKELGL